MITGGGGSIGSELCRQVAANFPALLVVVERSEFAAFQIEQELRSQFPELSLDVQVADVRDEGRMRGVLSSRRPSFVFHAAAHKHVPMMERQGAEAIANNTLATAKLARWCAETECSLFLLISTDKAINPTSLMGASKRLAELGLQALQLEFDGRMRFAAVRVGNVLGSSGSVIPIFKKQIAEGGPVTVTHPEVTRYFMTVHEAVGLVIQSATFCQGGEIFVLDMGEQMKISDMARQMIALSGLRPGEDIEIRYIGLRPGEKLYEELWHNGERLEKTRHPKIRALVSTPPNAELLREHFDGIETKLPGLPEVEL
jgi:FlaA1/EpsC-like NDP-sugar epimerase